jgi:hypothetical protein
VSVPPPDKREILMELRELGSSKERQSDQCYLEDRGRRCRASRAGAALRSWNQSTQGQSGQCSWGPGIAMQAQWASALEDLGPLMQGQSDQCCLEDRGPLMQGQSGQCYLEDRGR